MVSNHAGRQVDSAIAILDALEHIVAAVGDKIYIMYDSGVRGAADVAKVLALGAKFVRVGRLWVWGLSIMGETGVRHVMKSLLADFDIFMNAAGFQNVGQIDSTALGEFQGSCGFGPGSMRLIVLAESYPKAYAMIAEKSKL